MSNETSSTARTSPERWLPKGDSARLKTFVSLETSTRGTSHVFPDGLQFASHLQKRKKLIRVHYPAIIGTAANAATMPIVRPRLKCSCKKRRASKTVTTG